MLSLSKNLEKKLRARISRPEKEGQVLLEGQHLLEEALRAGQKLSLVVQKEDQRLSRELERRLNQAGVPVYTATEAQIKKISALKNPAKVLAVIELIRTMATGTGPIIFCDRIQDPGNLGTIIRTAAAVGAQLALAEGTVSPYNLKVLRATQGAIFHVPIEFVCDSGEYLKRLKARGWQLIGLAAGRGKPFFTVNLQRQSVIIVGNEGAGIEPDLLERCDQTVKLPQAPALESLNAAVAVAVVLYDIVRRENA